MKNVFLTLFAALMFSVTFASDKDLEIGDKAPEFTLKNVDGRMVSLKDFSDQNGVIVIFSCNHCPYVVAYEDRMIELHQKYAPQGFPIVAINPNDPEIQPQDSFEKMIERSMEKDFPFVYLFDDGQKVYPQYGATRTPHVYLLQNKGQHFEVAYIGAIDDNYKDAAEVEEKFLENAIADLQAGRKVANNTTRAIGCTIKAKK
jgi:peroxiredoxin